MRCEVVAVGTELLLGQVVDTNSAWLGDRLALAGIDCHLRTTVGDNAGRIAAVVGQALERAEAVVVCGGLGPTPDDVTREAVATALDVPLERDPAMEDRVRAIFAERHREMPPDNLRQADRPKGARFIDQDRGTAPGLICPAGADGRKVVYAVPGVPREMQEMAERTVIPDLVERADMPGVILSRMLRVWGLSESTVAERIAERVDQDNPTIAFLASGIEGLKVRITAKAPDEEEARRILDAEESKLRPMIGDSVFGVDDQSMERVVADLLVERDLTVGVAESLTGGLIASRLAETEGASAWFRGSVVAYDSKVKYDLLDVSEGPVVSEEAAVAMARGAAQALKADIGLGITGVAGPATQEGQPVGTVFMALADGDDIEPCEMHLSGDRQHIRQFSAISLLDLLRRRLLARD